MNLVEMIQHWRKTFSLPVRTTLQIPKEKEINLAIKLIKEEFDELCQGVVKKDLTEIQDALGDLDFVLQQTYDIFGINRPKTVEAVYKSNMSKLCKTEEEVKLTIEKYSKEGVSVVATKLDNGCFIIRRMSDNKVLKGINFKEPNFNENVSDI